MSKTETQSEALRLAGELESGLPVTGSAAAELRRLKARIAELERELEARDDTIRMQDKRVDELLAQRKPLTDEQISDALSGVARWQFPVESRSKDYDRAAACAIERAHGIGEPPLLGGGVLAQIAAQAKEGSAA